MSLLHQSLLAFGLLLASVLVASGTALAANNTELQTLINACELKNGTACGILGALYFNGNGVTKDYAKSIEYLTKGCKLNNAQSCAFLSELAAIGLRF